MDNDVNVAESSAAAVAEPAFDVKDQYTWTPEQREEWNKTGKIPAVEPKSDASAAPKPGEEAKPPAKKAESGTATPKDKPDQERNWRKLEADRDTHKSRAEALEKELSELKAAKPADEKKLTEAAAPALPQAPEKPKRPRFSEFANVADYEAAMDKYDEEMLVYPEKKRAFDDATKEAEKQKALASERQKKVNEQWKAITDKGVEIYGKDEWTRIITSQNPMPIYTNDPVELYVRSSEPEIAAHLLQYFGHKRSDLERIIALPMRQQFKEMEALEAAMLEELGKETPKKADSESRPEPKPRAPKPPSEVGGRGATPEDELRSAAASGNFARFEAEQNRRKFVKPN